jgi:hypothetical protein
MVVPYFSKNRKRLLFTSVFCLLLFACSDISPPAKSPDLEEQNLALDTQPEPLLSLSELLNADDVKQSLAQASAEKDQQALILWQERLLEAAEQVDLRPEERKLISGEQGLVYLEFQGMKTNYQSAFEKAFFDFADVEAVYEQYPAFENLHEASRDLVDKRDALISNIAAALMQDGLSEKDARTEARRQWALMMQNPAT